MQEVDNVLGILRKTKTLIESDNPFEIRMLSDQTIHAATVSQDPDNIIVAVLVYAVGKILERQNYRRMQGWEKFSMVLLKHLTFTIKHLEHKEIDKARNHLGRIRNAINQIDGDLSNYIREVFEKAHINKAFKMYEHGLSSQKTAELLGISLWDMASYIGQSTISEAHVGLTLPVQKRVKYAEDFFR